MVVPRASLRRAQDLAHLHVLGRPSRQRSLRIPSTFTSVKILSAVYRRRPRMNQGVMRNPSNSISETRLRKSETKALFPRLTMDIHLLHPRSSTLNDLSHRTRALRAVVRTCPPPLACGTPALQVQCLSQVQLYQLLEATMYGSRSLLLFAM